MDEEQLRRALARTTASLNGAVDAIDSALDYIWTQETCDLDVLVRILQRWPEDE